MAIEMIENSDLPAMMNTVVHYNTLPLDLYERTDGDQFANFSINNLNLLGRIIGEVKDSKAAAKNQGRVAMIAGVNKAYPIPVDNCLALQDLKKTLENEIYKVNQEILAGDSANAKKDYINAINARMTLVKNKIDELKCVEKTEQEQLEKDKQETLAALEKARLEGTPENPNQKINQYVIWGIAGLLVIGAAIILLKKKKTAQ